MNNSYNTFRVRYQTYVSRLSTWVLPYPSGYVFPVPFGGWPSLLRSSLSHWRVRSFLRLTYCELADSIGVTTFRTTEMQLVWVFFLLRGLGVLVEKFYGFSTLHKGLYDPLRLTHSLPSSLTIIPATIPNEASTRIHLHSPIQFFPGPIELDG